MYVLFIWSGFVRKNLRGYLLARHVNWVPVTRAWGFLRLPMEEWPLDIEGSCKYIDKQSLIANKGWSSSLEVGREAKHSAS